MICRLVGLCVWWLAFAPALSHMQLKYAVSAVPLVALGLFGVKYRAVRIGANLLYVFGIPVMLGMMHPHWILPPAVWGIVYVLGISTMYFLQKISSGKMLADAGSTDPSADELQTNRSKHCYSLLHTNCKFPIRRFAAFYLIWLVGIVWIATRTESHAPIILIAWSIVMLLLGYNSVWPFAIHPEWLGYCTRRSVFVTKTRWMVRFSIAVLLVAGCITAGILWGLE